MGVLRPVRTVGFCACVIGSVPPREAQALSRPAWGRCTRALSCPFLDSAAQEKEEENTQQKTGQELVPKNQVASGSAAVTMCAEKANSDAERADEMLACCLSGYASFGVFCLVPHAPPLTAEQRSQCLCNS